MKYRILFVDDEEPLTRLARRLLEGAGFEVEAFTCPKTALQEFDREPERFHLVITDLAMPVVCGEALARAVRVRRSDLPIIVTTGFGEQFGLEKAQACGVQRVLSKPVTRRELIGAVRKLLPDLEAEALS